MGTERHRVVINRLMRMVMTLHNSTRGLTEKHLENELGYSRSTVYRDLKSLQELDVGRARLRRCGAGERIRSFDETLRAKLLGNCPTADRLSTTGSLPHYVRSALLKQARLSPERDHLEKR